MTSQHPTQRRVLQPAHVAPKATVLLVATLLMAFFVQGSTSDASATASGHQARSAPGAKQMTRVTLKVNQCPHCPFELVQAISGRQQVWSSPYKHVQDGKVSFNVPTSRIDGMSIQLNPRWSGLDAVSNVVIRYGQEQVGSKVTADEAKTKNKAAGCLAGTELEGIQLTVQVRKFKIRDIQGNPSQAPRAWLAHTAEWNGPMTKTFKGTLGNQDAFYCTK